MDRHKLRLFFALWPGDALRDRLSLLMERFRPSVSDVWVKPENLHITLAFLGNVDFARLDAAMAAAAEVAAPQIDLMLDRIEFWRKPGVICLTPSTTPLDLQKLSVDLASQLRGVSFNLEKRPFRAHLTLARHAKGLPADIQLQNPLRWVSSGFVLVASQWDGQTSHYRVLRSWS